MVAIAENRVVENVVWAYCLRSRKDDRLAVMAPTQTMESVAPVVFMIEQDAIQFRQDVVGSKHVSRKQRKRGLKEWQVSKLTDNEFKDLEGELIWIRLEDGYLAVTLELSQLAA